MPGKQHSGPPILPGPSGNTHLTPRQLEVLELAAHGLVYKQIAAYLGISHRTVEDRFREMGKRVGTKTRGELLVYAAKAGLVHQGAGNSRDNGEESICRSNKSGQPNGKKRRRQVNNQSATSSGDQRSVDSGTSSEPRGDAVVQPGDHESTGMTVQPERPPPQNVLDALGQVAVEREHLDHVERMLIDTARRRRVTWLRIARALGLRSAQAAQQRRKRLGLVPSGT